MKKLRWVKPTTFWKGHNKGKYQNVSITLGVLTTGQIVHLYVMAISKCFDGRAGGIADRRIEKVLVYDED